MKYYYKKKEIRNKSEWEAAFRAAYSNKKNTPWEVGYSAERLADDFINTTPSSGEQTIVNMIHFFFGKDKSVYLDHANLEHLSKFDSYSHPRQQDLGIWGEVDKTPFFIGVEAKVNESFGSNDMAKQSIEAQKTPSNKDRYDKLVEDFLSKYNPEEYSSLRYQLLHYLAGSLREPNCSIIFMPVVVYVNKSVYNKTDGEKNKQAYKDFMDLLFSKVDVPENNEIKLAYKQEFKTWNRERTMLVTKQVYSCYIQK